MRRNHFRAFTGFALLSMLSAAQAQDPKTPYPRMAPIEQYLMERDAEVALARTAAPESISRDAAILFLGRRGYETAVPGKNGFECVVERSWTTQPDDPEFWNPKLRAPICFNAVAVRSALAQTIRKTELVMAGKSKAEMSAAISAALDRKELPAPETGAMCYMLSKQGNLNDHDGHWHPHLMFFVPTIDPATWGAGKAGSPILGVQDTLGRMTVILLPVGKWSDGTPAS